MSDVVTAITVARKQGITNRQAFQAILQKQSGDLAAIAGRHISESRLIQVAVGAAMRDPLLFECEAITVVRSLLQAAELQLGVGAEQEAHLVPFRNNKRGGIYECQLMIGYRGLLKLVWQSQLISSIDFGIVYEGDEFTYRKGTEVNLDHRQNFDRELPEAFWLGDEPVGTPHRYGMIRCVYAAACTIHGGKVAVVLTRSQVERYRRMSRAKDSNFWVGHWEAMALKTAIRQLCKVLPKNASLVKATALDEAHDSGDFSGLSFDIPEANPEEPEAVATQGMEAAKESLKRKALPKSEAEGPYSGPTVHQGTEATEGALL